MRNSLIILFLLIPALCFGGVEFDGDDDVLNCGTSDTLLPSGDPFTISAWLYPITSGENNYGRIIARDNAGDTAGMAFLAFDPTALEYQTTGSTDMKRTTSAGCITLNTWNHILMTTDGSTTATNTHIYVNNSECSYQQSVNGVSITDNTGAILKIGNRYDGGRTTDGTLTEIAIYDSVLGSADIETLSSSRTKRIPLQVAPSSLVAYWSLDDEPDGTSADGDTFLDLSGNGNSCTGDDGANNTGLTAYAEEVLTYQ